MRVARSAALFLLALSACATEPLAPDASINPVGRWKIIAVDEQPTGGGEHFNFRIEPPSGSAQFGCNVGNGALRVDRGWIVTRDWIVTTAGCAPERMRSERRGFDITGQPMTIEAVNDGAIRLRNRIGSIDLVRAPEVALNIIGEWTAVAIDGTATEFEDQFPVTITPTTITANLCNTISGGYRLVGSRLARAGPWRNTERGCVDPSGKLDPMATEARVFAILYGALTVATPTPDSLKLTSARGTIDFVRGTPLAHTIVGEWTAVAFDQRPATAADRFAMSITPNWLRAGLCNDAYGSYRVENQRIVALGPPWPRTERGCSAGRARLEDRAWNVLGRSPTITMIDPDRMRLTSARGSIDFERRR